MWIYVDQTRSLGVNLDATLATMSSNIDRPHVHLSAPLCGDLGKEQGVHMSTAILEKNLNYGLRIVVDWVFVFQ